MSGLQVYDPARGPFGKYLVVRRDGTVPRWPWFVLAAADPNAPFALRAYANRCEAAGCDPAYVADVRRRATEFEEWAALNGPGEPDGPAWRETAPGFAAVSGVRPRASAVVLAVPFPPLACEPSCGRFDWKWRATAPGLDCSALAATVARVNRTGWMAMLAGSPGVESCAATHGLDGPVSVHQLVFAQVHDRAVAFRMNKGPAPDPEDVVGVCAAASAMATALGRVREMLAACYEDGPDGAEFNVSAALRLTNHLVELFREPTDGAAEEGEGGPADPGLQPGVPGPGRVAPGDPAPGPGPDGAGVP